MSQHSTEIHGDQLAPHSPEAEEAVLGSVLLDPECLLDVLLHVTAADFFITRNGWVFEAMAALHADQMPIDHLTVVQSLEQAGRLGEVGGAAYIIQLINRTPSSLNVEGYARIVAEMSYRRKLIDLAQSIVRQAHADETSLNDIHANISREFAALSGPQVKMFTPAKALFGDFIDDLNDRVHDAGNGHRRAPVTTGLADLDEVFGGDLRPGCYNVVFGPTGIGKTWLMLQIALSAMRRLPVVYFTLEDTEATVRSRLVALESEVPYTFVKSGMINGGKMDDATQARCIKAASDLSEMPFEVVDYVTSPGEIGRHLAGATLRYGRPGLCFVDTLNQLADAVGREKRYENLTKASAVLLQTMRLSGWGIVATAQQRISLHAGMKWSAAKEAAWPTKHSLEGARTIVQHARNLVGMYSPDYIARETHDNDYDDRDCPRGEVLFLNVKSNDNDGRGQARLGWRSGIPKFGSIRSVPLDERDLWLGAKD